MEDTVKWMVCWLRLRGKAGIGGMQFGMVCVSR
jgi:hypothetical protein